VTHPTLSLHHGYLNTWEAISSSTNPATINDSSNFIAKS
jgi:hypothetical protein